MSISKASAGKTRLRRIISRGPIAGIAGGMLIAAAIQLPAAAAVTHQAAPQNSASAAQQAATQSASVTASNVYQVENQWGGSGAPWHPGGAWTIGARSNQHVVHLDITSSDGGKTLTGTMTYQGEGPIGFRGTLTGGNTYTVENQWGGSSAPWHPGGQWVIGGRSNQHVVAVSISSPDGGATLSGTMTYQGEGPIGFRATQS